MTRAQHAIWEAKTRFRAQPKLSETVVTVWDEDRGAWHDYTIRRDGTKPGFVAIVATNVRYARAAGVVRPVPQSRDR